MSLLLRMPQQLSDASMITIYAAVAVHRVLKQLYQADTQIKWVNDIFYEGKKPVSYTHLISRPDSGLESVYMKDEEAVRKRNPNHCFSMLISIK